MSNEKPPCLSLGRNKTVSALRQPDRTAPINKLSAGISFDAALH